MVICQSLHQVLHLPEDPAHRGRYLCRPWSQGVKHRALVPEYRGWEAQEVYVRECNSWLGVWNMFVCVHILGIIIPID